jgi:hypothetical protein
MWVTVGARWKDFGKFTTFVLVLVFENRYSWKAMVMSTWNSGLLGYCSTSNVTMVFVLFTTVLRDAYSHGNMTIIVGDMLCIFRPLEVMTTTSASGTQP